MFAIPIGLMLNSGCPIVNPEPMAARQLLLALQHTTNGTILNDCCFRWSRSICPEGCVVTTGREVPSGMMSSALWTLKASSCLHPNKTSSSPRSETARSCSRNVTSSRRRFENTDVGRRTSATDHTFNVFYVIVWFHQFHFPVFLSPAWEERWVNHHDLRRRRSGSETLMEACYRDVYRGMERCPDTVDVKLTQLILEVYRASNMNEYMMFLCVTRSSRCLKPTIQKAWKGFLSLKVHLAFNRWMIHWFHLRFFIQLLFLITWPCFCGARVYLITSEHLVNTTFSCSS